MVLVHVNLVGKVLCVRKTLMSVCTQTVEQILNVLTLKAHTSVAVHLDLYKTLMEFAKVSHRKTILPSKNKSLLKTSL